LRTEPEEELSAEEENERDSEQKLLLQMKRGYKVKRENMTAQEEYEYLSLKSGL
jgi:hypothetical protein